MQNIKLLISPQGLPLTYAIFYAVGLLLFICPATHPLFIRITPATLLLAAFSFLVFHRNWNLKTIAVLSFIFISSIIIEALGVATGKIFGVYAYHQGLGPKIAETPLLIGLNWVILVYGSNALSRQFISHAILRIFGASLLMVAFDWVMEYAAPFMQMWSFAGDGPPFRNFLSWFILGCVYQLLIEAFKIDTNNRPARALFLAQFFFFICIVIYSVFVLV